MTQTTHSTSPSYTLHNTIMSAIVDRRVPPPLRIPRPPTPTESGVPDLLASPCVSPVGECSGLLLSPWADGTDPLADVEGVRRHDYEPVQLDLTCLGDYYWTRLRPTTKRPPTVTTEEATRPSAHKRRRV